MQLTEQTNIAVTPSINSGTDPAVIVFDNTFYLFYTGPDGVYQAVWYVTSDDGINWSQPTNVRAEATNMGVLAGTNPCAAVFGDVLYLFYAGNGKNGIFCTTFTNGTWSQVEPPIASEAVGMNVMVGSSPCATVFNNTLYLFYTGSGNNGIWYTTLASADASWTPVLEVQNDSGVMNVVSGSSAAAVVSGNTQYLFFSSTTDGTINDIWWTSLSSLSDAEWSPAQSIRQSMPDHAMAVMGSTSPAAFVSAWDGSINVLWTDAGGSGICTTNFDGNQTWTAQTPMNVAMGGPQTTTAQTNPCAIENQGVTFVFWNGGIASTIQTASEVVLSPGSDFDQAMSDLSASDGFLLRFPNNTAAMNLMTSLNAGGIPMPLPDPSAGTEGSTAFDGDSNEQADDEFRILVKSTNSQSSLIPFDEIPPELIWSLTIVVTSAIVGLTAIMLAAILKEATINVSILWFTTKITPRRR